MNLYRRDMLPHVLDAEARPCIHSAYLSYGARSRDHFGGGSASSQTGITGTNSVGNRRRTVRYSCPEFLPLNSKNMQVDLPETTSKIGGPLVRQFSVFLPNKVGAMLEVVKLLNAHATHVVALSVSESTDAAIARIIVSDPERVEELFRENNVAFGVCELMVVELREVATQFIKILATLLMAEVNVHFSYPLLTRPNGRAALAMHVDDSECAASVLQGEGFRLLSQRDISR
jgi:hypothetical protein